MPALLPALHLFLRVGFHHTGFLTPHLKAQLLSGMLWWVARISKHGDLRTVLKSFFGGDKIRLDINRDFIKPKWDEK